MAMTVATSRSAGLSTMPSAITLRNKRGAENRGFSESHGLSPGVHSQQVREQDGTALPEEPHANTSSSRQGRAGAKKRGGRSPSTHRQPSLTTGKKMNSMMSWSLSLGGLEGSCV